MAPVYWVVGGDYVLYHGGWLVGWLVELDCPLGQTHRLFSLVPPTTLLARRPRPSVGVRRHLSRTVKVRMAQRPPILKSFIAPFRPPAVRAKESQTRSCVGLVYFRRWLDPPKPTPTTFSGGGWSPRDLHSLFKSKQIQVRQVYMSKVEWG